MLRQAITLLLLLASGAAPGLADAQAPPALAEYQLKALFLYNFGKFVEWPPGAFPAATTPFTIAVAGPDPFGGRLVEATRDRTVAGRPVVVRVLGPADDPRTAHIVFIGRAERGRVPALLAAVRESSVLTVSEVDDFLRQGGMINFVRVEDNVRFEINPRAAERAGLTLSSKLLSVARIVIP